MVAKRLSFLLMLGSFSLTTFLARSASIYYVDRSIPSSGDGTSPATAFKTVQEGIRAAANGDEIIVAAGTYIETIDFKGKAITVRSTDPADREVVGSTVIEPSGHPEVVRFSSFEGRGAIIAGFTITGGQVGVSCVWSSPVIRNNIIVANAAYFDKGGGIYCYYSSALIENNIIASNQAPGGGAGIACEGSHPVIVGNLILGNVTFMEGAGILCLDSAPTIARNRIVANDSQGNGGGISFHGSNIEVLNNLIVSNTANSMGGGIACSSSVARIVGNTIADNSAHGGGAGGLHFFDSSGLVANCVLWGNGHDISGWQAAFSCLEDDEPGDLGEGNIHDDPAFMDPDGADDLLGTEDDDYRLSPGSPCLDKGSFSAIASLWIEKETNALSFSWDPGVDLLGQSRISGRSPDMGCHELQSDLPTYVLESSLDLQEWQVTYIGESTHFFFTPLPATRRTFFRLSSSPQ